MDSYLNLGVFVGQTAVIYGITLKQREKDFDYRKAISIQKESGQEMKRKWKIGIERTIFKQKNRIKTKRVQKNIRNI